MAIRGKRGRKNKALFILIFLLAVVYFYPLNSAIRSEYFLGEIFKLDLRDYGKYSLIIKTPKESFVKKSSEPFFSYPLNLLGKYSVEVRGNNKREVYYFSVKMNTSRDYKYVPVENVSFESVSEEAGENSSGAEFKENFADRVILVDKRIRVGKKVRWKRIKEVPKNSDVVFDMPREFEGLRVKKDGRDAVYSVKGGGLFGFFESKNKRIEVRNVSDYVEIEYVTPAPKKEESELSEKNKIVNVFTSKEFGYKNVLVETNVSEFIPTEKKGLIEVYWVNKKRKVGFDALDKDGNGLIDAISWNVPHLSNQSFNISLKILNVHSYPVVGGNWTVRFDTLGRAPLRIEAINGTTWDPLNLSGELKFSEIRCGGEKIPYLWNNGVFINNFECNKTAYEVSNVLSQGPHYLKFTFGNNTAIAQNLATDPYDNLTQVYVSSFTQDIPLSTPVALNTSEETIVDSGYTHSQTANPSRVYINSTDRYKISYFCTFDNFGVGSRAIVESWIRKNGAEEIVPSRTSCYTRNSRTDADRCSTEGVFIANLSDGDYIELMATQLKQQATGNMRPYPDCSLYLQRVRRPVAQIYDSTGGDTYSLGSDIIVNLDAETYADSRAFTSDTANDRIRIDVSSWYKIYFHACTDNGPQTNRQNSATFPLIGSNEIIPGRTYAYYRNNGQGDTNCEQGFLLMNLSANDYISLKKSKVLSESGTASSTMIANQSWLLIEQVPFTDLLLVYESSGGQPIADGATNKTTFDTAYYVGSSYSFTPGDSRVFINKDGLYEVAYAFSWDDGAPGNDRNIACAKILVNGSSRAPGSQCDYSRGDPNGGRYASVSANAVLNISAGEYIEIESSVNGRPVSVLGGSTWLSVVPLNTFIDAQPPKWLGVSANNTNPAPGEEVNFSANWTDPSGLKSWDFFWDLGSGFVPAGSGTFSGENGTSTIVKTIPSSMEGKKLFYYFRARDLDDFENQTSGNDFVNVKDVTPPTINSQSVNNTNLAYLESLKIEANITDNTAVDSVWVGIRKPGFGESNYTMINISSDIWQYNYSQNDEVGAYNATIYSNDTSGNEGSGDPLYWNVTGYSNVSVYSPLGGDFPAEQNISIKCRVLDANRSIPIGNYPVNFYINESLIGTNLTNSSGISSIEWFADWEGTAEIKCNISNNSTLFYNASVSSDTSIIKILVPKITLVNYTHENLERKVNGWYSLAWKNRKKIEFDEASVDEPLFEYPLMINISDGDLSGWAQQDGSDILFTKEDGVTKLSHEIERYNSSSGMLLAWVRVNLTYLSNTSIYMYYNNSLASNQENASGTWNSDYGIVYHMNLSGNDSTSNQRDRIADVGSPLSDDSFLGRGVYFDGSSAWSQTDMPYWEAGYDVRINEIVFSTSPNVTGRQVLFAEGGSINGIMMYILNGYLYARWWSEGGSFNWGGDSINASILPNSKYHAVMGYAEGTPKDNYFLMLNGNLIDSRTAIDTIDAHTGNGAIGYTGTSAKDFEDLPSSSGHYFNGSIYEFRDLDAVRSYSWFNQTYKSVFGLSNFNVGPAEYSSNSSNWSLGAYETYDNIGWVNASFQNIGESNSSSVNVTLSLLYPNGSIADWFTPETLSCGALNAGENCSLQFNNSGSGFNITSNTGGAYKFNFTIKWSSGGSSPAENLTDVTVYHVPDNFSGALTDNEITAGQETAYSFNLSNPWNGTISGLNVTINCPAVTGFSCSCLDGSNKDYCFIGEVFRGGVGRAMFNISTNSSTPIGSYNINVSVRYTNPAGDFKTWLNYENELLHVKPLIAVIQNAPQNITRGGSANLDGYAKNIGTGPLTNVNASWSIPYGWTNTSGLLSNTTPSLGPDEIFWNNITVNVNLSSSLGPQTVVLTADSPDAAAATDSATITIFSNTSVLEVSSNNTSPLRGEYVNLSARLVYDNGTGVPGETIFFREGTSGVTNSSGYATVTYQIPLDAPTGTNNFSINASFFGNSATYLIKSENSSNISVFDQITITKENVQTLEGFGRNVTIRANVSSTNNISEVYANVSSPDGNNYFEKMDYISGDLYEINFSNTWGRGDYNYSVWANNTQGFSNESSKSSFKIESNFSVFIQTEKDFYTPNQIVNLTNGSEIEYVPTGAFAENGLIVVSGTTSATVTLSRTYQLNKSFIIANSNVRASNTNIPNRRMGRVYFSGVSGGFSNQLTASRGSSTDTMIASYSVLQSDNINACHISHTMLNGDGNDDVSLLGCDFSLPSNYASKCFVSTKHNVEATSTTSSCTEEQRVMANITNTTNLNLQRSSVACGDSIVEAQVVCFKDDTSVTPVHLGPSQFSTGVTTNIGHSINLSNSWLIYSCQSDGDGIEQANIECYFSSSSQVKCRTSSLGSTEVSNQECIGYVIEFPNGVNSEAIEHVPTNAEVGNVLQFNTTLQNPVDLNRTIGFCVSSFRSGEGTAYPRGEYPCYLQNSTNIYCERGRTGNTDPSHDLHCPVVQWPTIMPSNKPFSFIKNIGSTDSFAYFLMTVEHNGSGSWNYSATVLNDTANLNGRQISSLLNVNLSPIWNGPGEGSGWDTDANPGGYYRARFDYVDPSGNILENSGGSGVTSTYEFFLDAFPPDVNLTFPENGSTSFGLSATVNYTASDPSGVDSCSLFHNKSGVFTLEQTKKHVEGVENSFTITGFTENTYIRWNVRCNDSVGNLGFSSGDKFFYQIVPPDFAVNSSEIVLNNQSRIIEGSNVTINATIWNIGGQTGTTNVSFYLGDPNASGILIGNDTVTVPVGGFKIAQVNWSAVIGPANIYVVADPPIYTNGSVEEVSEENNWANNTFHIGAWQEFYGNSSIEVKITNAELVDLNAWGNDTILNGNVFIADTESSIDWNSLLGLGRNITGGNSTNDFSELDQFLGMENFTDSVSNKFTNSQIPKKVETFNVHGTDVFNVPVINSVNVSSFRTGILWDSSDDSDGEYGSEKEDIVFVSKFNASKSGAYGVYDYEATIPSKLREYNTTNDATNVYLYFDLN